MNRRAFLKLSKSIGCGMVTVPLIPRLVSAPLLAQSSSGAYRALVCVFLYGGNDGNNTLVPSDSFYTQYASGRSALAISRSDLNMLNVTSTGRAFGLHPSLRNVASLYNQGHATWLTNAGPLSVPYKKGQGLQGTPDELFSHAAQVGEWQSGVTQSASPTGWGGRIADLLLQSNPSTSPVVVSTSGWQLLGTGAAVDSAAIGTGNNGLAFLNALQGLAPSLSQMEGQSGTNDLANKIASMQGSYLSTTKTLLGAAASGSTFRTPFPSSPLGQQLQTIAQIINGRSNLDVTRQIFLSGMGGYDTHVDQLAIQASNLADLDSAVSSFAQAMQEIGMFEQVTLFTMTDFARSQQPNSTGGTDHAWGNHHLVVGGSVRGGDLYGTFPSQVMGGDDDFNTTGLWIPTTSGTQYAATMAKWLGVGNSDLNTVFPELSSFPEGTLSFVG